MPAEGTLPSQLRAARHWSLCSWCVLFPSILRVLMEEALKRMRAQDAALPRAGRLIAGSVFKGPLTAKLLTHPAMLSAP